MPVAKRSLDAWATTILLGLCLLWGLNQVAIKVANTGVRPIFQAAFRSLLASLLLLLRARLQGTPLLLRGRPALQGVVIGLLFGTEFVCLYLGLSLTTASHGVLFLYTAPVFVALGAHWFLPHEPLTARISSGLTLAFLGVLATLWDSLSRPTASQWIGDLLCLLAGGLWAATSLYLKAVVGEGMTAAQMLFYQLGVSAVPLALLSAMLEPRPVQAFSLLVVGALAYQAVVVAFASYLAWFWLIRTYPISQLSGFTFFTPVFGVVLGGVLLQEPLTGKLLLGGALVAGGMALVNWPQGRLWGGTRRR